MAVDRAPVRPNRSLSQFIDPRTGNLSDTGLQLLESMWRQIAAGQVVVPVEITQDSANILVMTPELHEEGAASYGNGMSWFGKAVVASTGSVTAYVTTPSGRALPAVKVYKSNGAAQAGAGDIALNGLYLFVYHADLDGGAGGLVRF
jgi:hypothetical protein